MIPIFKTIIRNFIRKPVTNLINLIGLTISLTLVIILSVYCYSELNTDNHQKNRDRIYLYGLSEERIYTPGVLKDQIDLKVPGVESTVRIGGTWEVPVFQVETNEPITCDLLFADEGFFNLFTYYPVEGSLETALKEPLTIVITKRLKEKLFGRENALGRVIKLNNSNNLTVSAVIDEPKTNSCLSFSAVTSIATRKIVQSNPEEYTEWGWSDFQTFLLLKKGINPDVITKTILTLFPEEIRKDYNNEKLTPLKKIYFSKFDLYGSTYILSGDRKKVMILAMVAVLVLMVALINFINISSSQWQEKLRQTGVLKVIGASRSNILLNILVESFLFFLAALLLATELISIITPFINRYTGITFSQNLTYSPLFIFYSVLIILFLSVLFSIIPALRISSSRAIDNLKKNVTTSRNRFTFRGVLVTMQFAIAIVLISFTLLVQKQVRFGINNTGFNQDNLISIKLTGQLNQKKGVLKDILDKNPIITKVSLSQFYPGRDNSQWRALLDLNGEKKEFDFDTFSADAAFFEMMGLKIISGRFYTDDLSLDRGKVVVNETTVRKNNLPNPIGGKISMGNRVFEIIGVVKDFHYKPVNQPIASLAIRNDSYASYCLVKIQANNFKSLSAAIDNIKKTVSELSPSFPVEVNFIDNAIESMYKTEVMFRHTFSLLAGCAIVVCSLGILAISIFGCQRRVKEIGIRKVNGAKITEILVMLNNDFVKWVMIAFVISVPVAWYFMQTWLKYFAYKTELSWWIFALSGVIALTIALITVSWQSWRAAARNPVEALRYE